jgi:hypothetical protein
VLQACGIDTELDAINAWEREFCENQSTQSSSRSSSGLSRNAKIGLAAGIPCGLLAIAAGVGLYFLGKYKARKKYNLPHNLDIPKMRADENSRCYEVDRSEVQQQELETNANRVELSETTAVDHRP